MDGCTGKSPIDELQNHEIANWLVHTIFSFSFIFHLILMLSIIFMLQNVHDQHVVLQQRMQLQSFVIGLQISRDKLSMAQLNSNYLLLDEYESNE